MHKKLFLLTLFSMQGFLAAYTGMPFGYSAAQQAKPSMPAAKSPSLLNALKTDDVMTDIKENTYRALWASKFEPRNSAPGERLMLDILGDRGFRDSVASAETDGERKHIIKAIIAATIALGIDKVNEMIESARVNHVYENHFDEVSIYAVAANLYGMSFDKIRDEKFFQTNFLPELKKSFSKKSNLIHKIDEIFPLDSSSTAGGNSSHAEQFKRLFDESISYLNREVAERLRTKPSTFGRWLGGYVTPQWRYKSPLEASEK